jgi:hypothetical protein
MVRVPKCLARFEAWVPFPLPCQVVSMLADEGNLKHGSAEQHDPNAFWRGRRGGCSSELALAMGRDRLDRATGHMIVDKQRQAAAAGR